MAALRKSATLLGSKLVQKRILLPGATQVRCLNLQEYQSKKLMKQHNVNVQSFELVESLEQAKQIGPKMNVNEYVIKAQILAGGRGKGTFSNGYQGGVKLTKSADELVTIVEKMLGHRLVTKQTGKDGVLVSKIMIGEALDITKETYFAILLDRETAGPVLVGSPKGGMDIEEVAATEPEAIFKESIDIFTGITDEQANKMAKNLDFKGPQLAQAAEQIKNLYKMFIDVDATQVEINPLGETADGRVVCFDAKVNFDDNAAYRQKEVFSMDDTSETDPREVEAAKSDLNYIGMDGNIGCLVNGAGLAMATMDIIQLHGGSPANFLDVGGNVSEKQVEAAFKLLSKDQQVKAILVNVFGGIVNCATVANGITSAYKTINLAIPVVVRLQGTNMQEAVNILNESGLPIIPAQDLDDAAQKAVASL